MTVIIVFLIIFLAIVFGFVFFIIRHFRRKRILESLELNLLAIRIPQESKENKDLKDEINLFEQLLSAMSTFRKPFIFETAVSHVGEEIGFYLAVPKNLSQTAQKHIQSLWPDAQVELVEDYNIFNYSGAATGAFIKLKEHFAIPLRTYQELNADTFLPILGALAHINEVGEGAAIQVLVRPVPSSAKKNIQNVLKSLKEGKNIKDILGSSFSLSAIQEVISSPQDKEKPTEKILDEIAIKAVEMKLAKPLFQVNTRLITSAPSSHQADSLLESLVSGFSQFSAPGRNELKMVKPRNSKKLIYDFSFRQFNDKQEMTLNSEELASLFHLPTPFTDIPRIKWLKSKAAAPPSNLAKEGVLIGQSVFRDQKKKVYISEEDRRRHIYMIGQTGTGKSTLLSNMIIDDINNGKGVAIIDPHGDLVEAVLALIPKHRIDDVIIFDPADFSHPLGLNMIEYDQNHPEEKTFIVNEMQSIFNKLFSQETMGPMFEQYMRNALLLLMEANEPATLTEVPRIFTDADFRARKLKEISNPIVIDFWEKEAVKAGGEAALANMTPYITSKFNIFIANDYVRPIIGQVKSAFNFRQVMDEGKILLVNLSKGRIGDINAGLLGMIIVGKILMASLSRVDIPQEKRRDFYLFIDEFQNFTTDSIAVILSEARKYRLNLTLAHQFIAQLTEDIRDAVFGNVGSMVTFRVGVQDAEFLVKQFDPVFSERDLINIDNFNAYVKILIRGETSQAFNIRTFPPEAGDPELINQIKELSRTRYGRPRQEVEMEISKRLKS